MAGHEEELAEDLARARAEVAHYWHNSQKFLDLMGWLDWKVEERMILEEINEAGGAQGIPDS